MLNSQPKASLLWVLFGGLVIVTLARYLQVLFVLKSIDEVEVVVLESKTDVFFDGQVIEEKMPEEMGELRGWPLVRATEWSQAAALRVQRPTGPVDFPALNDPGVDYLPFKEELVRDEFKNSTRFYYEISLYRMRDMFGLIEDDYTVEEWEEILQRVVDIYAVGNIYLRINRDDILTVHSLGRKESLLFLSYVEGPDAADLKWYRKDNRTMPEVKRNYMEWIMEETRKEFPFRVIDTMVETKQLLKRSKGSLRFEFARNLLELVIGFPHLHTSWELAYTTPLVPVFYLHAMNGECVGGRVTGRTGSCWEKMRPIHDENGKFIKNATCRRFFIATDKRKPDETPFIRKTEMKRLEGDSAARMWAHEVGHSLTLRHPRSKCNHSVTWEENNLMLQQRYVGLKKRGCPDTPTDDQARGVFLFSNQLNKVREFIKIRDIKPSATLPRATNIGLSTEQIGVHASQIPYERLRFNHVGLVGAGSKFERQPCQLPQTTVVLTRLPSPMSGEVRRIRWMPYAWRSEPFKVVVAVVAPATEQSPQNVSSIKFQVISRTKPIEVPRYKQQMHIEVDLPEPLPIRPGRYLALSSVDGKPLDIDQQLYPNHNTLFGDVVGKLPKNRNGLHSLIMEQSRLAYPKVFLAARLQRPFFSSDAPLLSTNTTFVASTSGESKTEWCSSLILNFDVV